jgi:hypothetical protein
VPALDRSIKKAPLSGFFFFFFFLAHHMFESSIVTLFLVFLARVDRIKETLLKIALK